MSRHDFLKTLPPAPKPDGIHPATGLVAGSFGIGTFRAEGRTFPGVVQPDGVIHDVSALYGDTHSIFDDWDRALDRLADVAAKGGDTQHRLDALEILAPLHHPNILGAGSNYRQHVAEMMTFNNFNQHSRLEGETDEQLFQRMLGEVDRRKREGMPFFWTGLHSALGGPNDDIQLPLIGAHMDWELELGVVVARTGRYVPPEEADRLIAGYVMINDLGTVDEFRRADVRFQFYWISKNQPGCKPLGPFVVPKQFVDRSKIQITLRLNGEIRQDWPTTDMIFTPEDILSYASERIVLQPGDVLFTGSPPGNAGSHGEGWLKDGDVIESEITYLGRQRNRVRHEETGDRKPTYGPFITSW